jgi:hypothetical protein
MALARPTATTRLFAQHVSLVLAHYI